MQRDNSLSRRLQAPAQAITATSPNVYGRMVKYSVKQNTFVFISIKAKQPNLYNYNNCTQIIENQQSYWELPRANVVVSIWVTRASSSYCLSLPPSVLFYLSSRRRRRSFASSFRLFYDSCFEVSLRSRRGLVEGLTIWLHRFFSLFFLDKASSVEVVTYSGAVEAGAFSSGLP